jgi:3-oxoacyl-[acyl-carrier-protein] synthase II
MSSTAQRQFYRQPPGQVLLRNQNVGIAAIAKAAHCRGPVISVSTACAGAAHAIGEGYRRVLDGECTAVVAGGFDSLTTWMDVLGFSLLGALTDQYNDEPERACRPFDAGRAGFVLGEGAVMAVLEDWSIAMARGAHIHGEVVGYGSSLNAYRITDSPPDGGGAVSAMRSALSESGLPAADVDYVVAHGTGTHGNDLSETAAIKAVFGPSAHHVAISSPKSMTGHLTSAAAGINLLAALGAIREGLIPPTINLENADPRLDLDYVPLRAREREVNTVMVNAFAFGGTNASLVIRRATPAAVGVPSGPMAAAVPQ